MGLEALSRGASKATFIDLSRDAMDIVKKNAESTKLYDQSKFVVSDAANYLRKMAGREKFDLVFIDPPYAMNLCKKSLEALLRYEALNNGAIVVIESGEEEIDLNSEPYSRFEVIKSTSYGKKTTVNILGYFEKD
jgi:16S rRNA (guanine(966)-N(2))-methyltransferase RsmD